MATPAFRAAGTAVFTANNVANPTALTPVKSGSTVNGDLMLCIAESRSITATVGTPTGWTLLAGFPIRSGTASGGSVYVFSRIATGGADDAPTITWTGLTTGTNGDSAGARIISWSGAVETQAGTVTSTDAAITTSATMPAITTTFGNALIVGIVVKINDTVHTWSVATRTERSDDHTTTGTGHGTVVADLVQTAVGASGTAAATPSTTVSSRSLAISIAMKPVIVTATVGQATETDTARRLAVPVGRATETDTSAATGRRKTKAIAQATDTETARRLAVPVGRATDTETAGALTWTKLKAIGQASDAETAQAVTGRKTKAIGQATDTETAAILTPVQTSNEQTIDVGQAVETDTAGATTALKTKAIGQATDTETATAVAAGRIHALAAAAEADSASTASRLKSRAVAQALEADTSATLAATKLHALAAAGEADSASAASRLKSRAVAQASDTETASPLGRSKARAIGQATATETAGAVTVRVRWPLPYTDTFDGPALDPRWEVELDGPGASVTADGNLVVATPSPAENAYALAWFAYPSAWEVTFEIVSVDAAADSFDVEFVVEDSGFNYAVSAVVNRALGGTTVNFHAGETVPAGEPFDPVAHRWMRFVVTPTDQTVLSSPDGVTWTVRAQDDVADLVWDRPFVLSLRDGEARIDNFSAARLIRVPLARATEVDTALALTHTRGATIAQASSTETAGSLTSSKRKAIGEAGETDTAPGVLRVAVARAAEADSARVVASQGHLIELGITVETDTAEAAARVKVKALGAAAETDTAPATGHGKLSGVALAEETSIAAALAVVLAHAVSPATETDSALAASSGKATLVLYAAEANIAVAITPVGGAAPTSDVRPTRGFVATIHEGTVSRAAPADSGIDAGLVARIRTGSVDQ